MNWKQFKELTPLEQEQWKFKFKEKTKDFSKTISVLPLVCLYFLTLFLMMLILLALNVESFEQYEANIIDYIILLFRVTGAIVIIVVLEAVGGLLHLCYWTYKENKWIKEKLRDKNEN